ncbi:MAG TPA: hemolysin III family protein [Xanthomonadaceae bacterium]|nr:hemolysin III family protein [Xanthomonadaceae bacterium]
MNAHRISREELANALTHGAGLLASVAGGAVLIAMAALFGSASQIVSAVVFVATLILLYTASTLYHAARHDRLKAQLKVLDHCAIFILIAGTYTPFTLVGLKGGWGWTLFGLVWTLAVLGVVFKLFFTGRFHRTSTVLYVAMGWLALIAIGPLVNALPAWTLGWLLAGGIAYTAGTAFYHNERVPYAHAIWHLFVLAGSVLHFIAVASLVVPAATV